MEIVIIVFNFSNWPPVTTFTNETMKHAFHVCHTPAAQKHVSHICTGKFPMHNLQCQTNNNYYCLESIVVKKWIAISMQKCSIHLSHLLVGLKLNFRDWKPTKNTFHWNILDIYATCHPPPVEKCYHFLNNFGENCKACIFIVGGERAVSKAWNEPDIPFFASVWEKCKAAHHCTSLRQYESYSTKFW